MMAQYLVTMTAKLIPADGPPAAGADKTALLAILMQAEFLVEADYTTTSLTAFISARNAARTSFNNANAGQPAVNAATAALKAAIGNLIAIYKPPVTEPPVTEPPVTEPPITEPPITEPPVTEPPATGAVKTALASKLAEAETFGEKDYTALSWAYFLSAYNMAKLSYNYTRATQATVDLMLANLTRAMEGLRAGADLPQLPPNEYIAEKISNPGLRGGADGVDPDPRIGIHNSYAWCSEVFQQDDAEYLWVGMNRDLGTQLLGGADPGFNADFLYQTIGIPHPSDDQAAKIYRQRVSDNDAGWELMYENPAINGYRRMIIFNGELYVVAALTNTGVADYSFVLRFPKDFKPGDVPDVVLWENTGRIDSQVFRAATVLDGTLYIGTFDGKIYATRGEGLQNLTPGAGDKATGWSLVMDLSNSGARTGTIWDMIGFNGYLYAFVNVDRVGTEVAGFGVYKIDPNQGYSLKQVVGDNTARYPYGMGLNKLATASPFLSASFDEDYVYVSTFSGGGVYMLGLLSGFVEETFDLLVSPCFVFRFDKNDNWETVVGDREGEFVAVDGTGSPLPIVGNQRAGFFLQDDEVLNTSFNHYVWWMAEYDGRMYAATWDSGFVQDEYAIISMIVFGRITAVEALMPIAGYIREIMDIMADAFGENTDVDMQALTGELNLYFRNTVSMILGGGEVDAEDIIQGYLSIVKDHLTDEDCHALLAVLTDMIYGIYELDYGYEIDTRMIVARTLEYLSATAVRFCDFSNPNGFDLYVTDDGINFQPVTVDGFGDANNYGGRVMVPSRHGLFVGTANPFTGAQVWRLNHSAFGIYPNGPKEVGLKEGEIAGMTVQVRAGGPDDGLIMRCDSQIADVRLVKRGNTGTFLGSKWDNQIKTNPRTYMRYYDVVENTQAYDTQMYDVIITAKAAGEQDLTIYFETGGVTASYTISLKVTAKEAPAATLAGAVTSAGDFISIRETAKNSRLWEMTFKVTETYSDGTIKVVTHAVQISANNANISGEYNLGEYTLIYDVKGNGSNIKEFRVVLN